MAMQNRMALKDNGFCKSMQLHTGSIASFRKEEMVSNPILQIHEPFLHRKETMDELSNQMVSFVDFVQCTLFDGDDTIDAILVLRLEDMPSDVSPNPPPTHQLVIELETYRIKTDDHERDDIQSDSESNHFISVWYYHIVKCACESHSHNPKLAMDTIGIPTMISTKIYHCTTHDCEHHDNTLTPILQIVGIGLVQCNMPTDAYTKKPIYKFKQPKYYVTLSDGYQIVSAYCMNHLSCLIDTKKITLHDFIQVTKWMPRPLHLIIEDAELLQKHNRLVSSVASEQLKPYWYQFPPYYAHDYSIIDFLWSPDVIRAKPSLACGCTCKHKRESMVIDKTNFTMSNKDDGTNLHNVIDLVQQTIKEVVSFEMNTRNTNTNSYETQSQGWQYCTQCAYEFMLPDNMKQLLHCAQQQGMNFLLDVLLFKLLHYPLIFKALRRFYKSLLNYWFNSCRYMFRHWTWKALHEKSFGRGGPSPDKYKMITFGMMSVSFLQTQQYFLLQWMETGYFKRKHFNFIMKRNPNILRDLLQILRVKYIKLGPQSVFNGKQKLIA
eukprot:185643_1